MTACVYRCFDDDNRVVYIGVTNNLERRLAHHHSMGLRFARVTHETYASRPEALAAEAAAIAAERPPLNTQHNPDAAAARMEALSIPMSAEMRRRLERVAGLNDRSIAAECRRAIASHLEIEGRVA